MDDESRMTTWPASPLPHPPIRRRSYRLTDDASALIPTDADVMFVPDTAGETYLKLRAIDLSDAEAILAFVSEHGLLGIRTENFAATRGTSGVVYAVRASKLALSRARATYVGEDPLFPGDDLWQDTSPTAETLVEFRFAAAWLHDLTNLWLVYQGENAQDLEWRVLLDLPPFLNHRGSAASMLSKSLAPALKPFSPQLIVRGAKDVAGIPIVPSPGPGEFARAPLVSVCALELFNHIAETATYRPCANETCGRLFVRQEGRAQAGQHRKKRVAFCSQRCLRQQKQREYRRREKDRQQKGARGE
jgi:hypothetical protein